MFELTTEQINFLQEFAANYTQDQSYLDWHQEQKKSADNFKKMLTTRNFNQGGEIPLEELYQIGKLVWDGLGNTNLIVRGNRSPFEANDLKDFNNRLRNLLYSSEDLGHRVDSFFDMKFIGLQTVSQFLCKFDYLKYPFFANYMIKVFNDYLNIDENQLSEARKQAELEFRLGTDIRHKRTYEYFQYSVILKEIKNKLKLEDYLETQNLLWRFSKDLENIRFNAHYVKEKGGFQIDDSIIKDEHKGKIFSAGELSYILEHDYEIPIEDQLIEGWTEDFKKEAKKYVEEMHGKISEPNLVAESLEAHAPKYTIDDFINETSFTREKIEEWRYILKRKQQIVFQGPPGTGKTFVAEKLAKLMVSETNGFWEVVQFHSAYSYEDFIQGFHPEIKNNILTFDRKPGRFLEFCEKARKRDDNTPCVLIIDEINRANLARVFGELMYLLEYRDEEIPLASGGRPFRIPKNVHLIGTMNTADRSIALVDHALRRRFSFIRLTPKYDILKKYLDNYKLPSDSLIETLIKINKAINDQNYFVGISFFMKDGEYLRKILPIIWISEIEPYLEEYFYDDQRKVESFKWEQLAKENLRFWVE